MNPVDTGEKVTVIAQESPGATVEQALLYLKFVELLSETLLIAKSADPLLVTVNY